MQINNCSTCKYWHRNSPTSHVGRCDAIDDVYDDDFPNDSKILGLNVTVSDDSGLNADLITGADFGCIRYER